MFSTCLFNLYNTVPAFIHGAWANPIHCENTQFSVREAITDDDDDEVKMFIFNVSSRQNPESVLPAEPAAGDFTSKHQVWAQYLIKL